MMPPHDENSRETRVNKKATTWFLWTAAGVVVVMLINWILVRLLISGWSDRGSYGDMFGAANTLFSGLAFAGVIYAILLQRHELQLQREELISTRDELQKSAKAQELSEKALREQAKMMLLTAQIHGYSTVIGANETEFDMRRQGISMSTTSTDDITHAWRANLEALQQIMLEVRAHQVEAQRESTRSTFSVDNNSK